MADGEKIGFFGGDSRQRTASRGLSNRGYPLETWGLSAEDGATVASALALARSCDTAVFPLPVTKDGTTLFAPFSGEKLLLSGELPHCLLGKRVFTSQSERLLAADDAWRAVHLIDYGREESLAISGAFATAEGALALAITQSKRTLNGSMCLVTGFGRVARALCHHLHALGAHVTVAARKAEDRTLARALGYASCSFSELSGGTPLKFQFLWNTVPAPVITEKILAQLDSDCLCMELSSAPGGFERSSARPNLEILDAPGLPGRFSPESAGESLLQTLLVLLEE